MSPSHICTLSRARAPIKKRLTDLWNFEKMSSPSRHGPRYVFSRNNGLQNQSVY